MDSLKRELSVKFTNLYNYLLLQGNNNRELYEITETCIDSGRYSCVH